MTYVFDTSSLLRLLHDEAGADRVEEIFVLAAAGRCGLAISAVNWGELIYVLANKQGLGSAERAATGLIERGLTIVGVSEERARRAGLIKSRFKIGYADCFGVELAQDSQQHTLVTADYGAKPVERHVFIEFLPAKQLA